MSRVGIEQIRTFLAVYQLGSISRAADRLGLSQPTVNAQLTALEKGVGRALFVRGPRGLKALPAACHLAEGAGPRLEALEQFIRGSIAFTGAPGMLLTVGGPADLTTTLVLPTLAGCRESGTAIRAVFGTDEQLIDLLTDGCVDLAITMRRPSVPGLRAVALLEEEFILVGKLDSMSAEVADDANLLARNTLPAVACEADLSMVRRYWTAVFGRALDEDLMMVVPDTRSAVEALRRGGSVGILPHYMVAEAVGRGELAVLCSTVKLPSNPIFLVDRGEHMPAHIAGTRDQLLMAAKAWDLESLVSAVSGVRDGRVDILRRDLRHFQ
ncbi:LysR family transcriptional regulator [Nocardia sp. NBC_00511]|uniref:LysR family transcriptional regulator n=1 Tax=Nocardia sp. NBC_00511 TaxID=2903591 RepID=UPI0030E27264